MTGMRPTIFTAALVALSLLLCAAAIAEPVPGDVAAYAAKSRRERAAALEKARRAVENARKNRASDSQLRRFEDRVLYLENPLATYYAPLDLKTARIGDIGMLATPDSPRTGPAPNRVQVFQVVGPRDAIVEFVWFVPSASGKPADTEKEQRYWLAETDTSQFVDGKSTSLEGVYWIPKTVTYKTAAASNTILMLAPLDISSHRDLFTRKRDTRIWKSKNGQHHTEAIYGGYNRGKVLLVRPSGDSAEVPLSELSDEDRKFVREQLRKQ